MFGDPNAWKIVTDLLFLTVVSLPPLLFKVVGWPFRRGFYCDDESIRYPYETSTVSVALLNSVGFGVPILIISFIEAYRVFKIEPNRQGYAVQSRFTLYGYDVHPYLCRLYYYIGFFLFGAAAGQTLTDVGKYSIGRLRPHFITVCKPYYNNSQCSAHIYIENFVCQGERSDLFKDIRMSFPSGHSSLAAYTMFFTILYIQARMNWKCVSLLVKPVVQFVLLCLAVGTALSRVSNYKHHWSDVFAGFTLGVIVACINAIHVVGMFKRRYVNASNNTSFEGRVEYEQDKKCCIDGVSEMSRLTEESPPFDVLRLDY